MIDWKFVLTFIVAFSIYEIGKGIIKEIKFTYRRFVWRFDPLYKALLMTQKK